MLLVVLRWAGTVALLCIFAGRQFRQNYPLLKSNIGFLLAMGALGLTAFNALFYVAAYTTTAVNIGIIQGSIPVFVLVGSFFLYQTKVHIAQVIGIIVTMIGVVIVTTNAELGRLLGLQFAPGDLLMVVACLLYAGYSVCLQRCPDAEHMSLFTLFAIGALLAAIPLAIAEFFMGNSQMPTPRGWVVIALITLFPSFIAHWVYIKGVSIIGVDRAGIFFNLVPVFAALIAVAFLGEVFKIHHGVALGLILGGIAISELSKSANKVAT